MSINEVSNILDVLAKLSNRHVEEMTNIRRKGVTEKNYGEFVSHAEAFECIHKEILYYNRQLEKLLLLG